MTGGFLDFSVVLLMFVVEFGRNLSIVDGIPTTSPNTTPWPHVNIALKDKKRFRWLKRPEVEIGLKNVDG